MTPEERLRHIREVAERVAERLVDQWPQEGAHINELEDFAERMGQSVQREVSERVLQDEAARREGNQSACPDCGAMAPFQRLHWLTLVTAAGRQPVQRPYYLGRACGTGHCPADRRLGRGPGNTTPTAQARLAVLSTLEPYVQVADLIFQLALPLQLDVKTTERVTQAVGARLAAVPGTPYGATPRPVALGFDGVMVRTWEGRKEARVGVIYEPDREAPRTPAGEAGLRKEYFATTGSRESLVAAVCARARERAAGGVVAVVSDGAALAWVDLDLYLPLRVEILDFYHVLARVGEVARAMYPGAAASALAWQAAMKKELLAIGPWDLVRKITAWEPESAEGQEVRRVQLAYFERQQERMRYPDYRRRGFPLGSGAVEGACKHVVVDRLRGSGMGWKLPTAEPVMQLRAALLTQPRLDLRGYAASPLAPAAA